MEPGSFVAMAPAAAYGPAKEWPAAHYVRLAMLLAHQRGLRTVVIGAPAEGAKCGEVASLAADRAPGTVSAAGMTDLAELAALMKLSCGFVGNDSGAMHLAGVTGIPTVGIFGSTRPDVTGPLGPRAVALAPADDVREKLLLSCVPCLRRTCRYGHYRCLKSLSPEEALDALAWMLDNPEGRGSPPSAPRGKIVNPGGAK